LLVFGFMPQSPKQPPKQPMRRDKGVGDQELEDRVGRRPDEKPDMVPPGQPVGRPEEDDDDKRELPDDPDADHGTDLHDEALEADRATARRSDRIDARDGVDPSDTMPFDPDSAVGSTGRKRS
jgi:hypothetical protein